VHVEYFIHDDVDVRDVCVEIHGRTVLGIASPRPCTRAIESLSGTFRYRDLRNSIIAS
jgi:hypothetical protein